MARSIFRPLIFLLLIPITGFAADPCDEAYSNGKATESLSRCRSEAQAGSAEAEFGYALILWSGHDQANDQREALEWFHKSARQGHKLAQVALGMFMSQEGIDKAFRNLPEAYAWFVTAGETDAANRVLSQLTSSEAQTAKKMAKEYQAKYRK
jgi:TPR repeat protein